MMNTILYCRRWQETVTFYREALGFPVAFQNEWFVELKVNTHARLSIANEQRATVKSSGGQGLTITFQVDNADDKRECLQLKGIPLGKIKDHPWGGRSFFCMTLKVIDWRCGLSKTEDITSLPSFLPLLITGVTGVPGYSVFKYFHAKYPHHVTAIRPVRYWPLRDGGLSLWI